MVPSRIAGRWRPGSALVLDLDPHVITRADHHADREASTVKPRLAVQGRVRRQLGGAEDHVVGHRAVAQHRSHFSPDSADMLRAAWVGDADCTRRKRSRCWWLHGSSLLCGYVSSQSVL